MNILVLSAVLAGGVSASDLPDCDSEGPWEEKHNCFGFYRESGMEYVGEYWHGAWHGRGTKTWGDGRKYTGQWKHGLQSGQGIYTSADGSEYVGEFKSGWRAGQGTFTWANGDKYVGQWKRGEMNGQGTYTSKDRTIREGIWEDGEFLGTVAEVERAERTRIAAEEKVERIYNACLLDKAADVDMSVSSLEKAVQATCRSIAKDPSFLEGFRYD